MAKNLTPSEVAAKQIKNAQASVEDMKLGIQRTTKKPMQLAKAAIPKMKQNFNRAVDDGSVAAGFDSVSDGDWKDAAIAGTDANYSGGLQRSLAKQTRFQEARAEFIKSTQSAIDAMPSTTDADNKARMNANFERMKQFKYRRRLRK